MHTIKIKNTMTIFIEKKPFFKSVKMYIDKTLYVSDTDEYENYLGIFNRE